MMDNGFVDIARLMAGGSFGQNALIDGKPRFCTTRCIERCHLLYISKANYIKSIEIKDKKKSNELVNFIKRIPLFEGSSRTQLSKLTSKLQFKTLIRGEILYN